MGRHTCYLQVVLEEVTDFSIGSVGPGNFGIALFGRVRCCVSNM